jgi:hypothetical protein
LPMLFLLSTPFLRRSLIPIQPGRFLAGTLFY